MSRESFQGQSFSHRLSLYNNDKDYVNDHNGGDNDDLAGEEEHEDGGGGKQLQILHKGDKMLLHVNLSISKYV